MSVCVCVGFATRTLSVLRNGGFLLLLVLRESVTLLGNVIAQLRQESTFAGTVARQAVVSMGERGEDGGVSEGDASWGEDAGVWRRM